MASDGALDDHFGTSVSIDGDRMVVGAWNDDIGTVYGQGSAYVFERQASGSWLHVSKLTAFDGALNDDFGSSVSIDGGRIVVGAPFDDNGTNYDQGSAYVFERASSGIWSQTAKLTASDGASSDWFGISVCCDGGTIVIGAKNTDGLYVGQGSIYVFERQASGAWVQTAELWALDGALGDGFGSSAYLDVGRIVVGSPGDDMGAVYNQGSAYVFEKQASGSWLWAAKLTASDGAASDSFGCAVSIDGDRVVVGAPGPTSTSGTHSGSAYVYERQASGYWPAVQTARLTATDATIDDKFGESVSIDTNTIVIGARYGDGAVINTGGAYVFERQASGSWPVNETAKLTAFDGVSNDLFGSSVSVDGGTIVAGAHDDWITTGGQGSAYVFDIDVAVNLDNLNTGYASLAEAISDLSTYNGDRIAIRSLALQASGIIDASSKKLTFVGVEPLSIGSDLLLRVADESAFVKSPEAAAAGLTVGGALIAPEAGTLTFEDLAVLGGQVMQRGATLLVNQDVRTRSGGTCYLSGEILADLVATSVGGQNRVSATTDVFSNYDNAGATIVQRGTLYIYGNLTNTGTMVGDVNNGLVPPSPGDGFNVGGDYVVGADASLTMPDPVWWLRVGGHLDIAINDPARFVMDQATIELTGLAVFPAQEFEAVSADLGPVMAGFATSNFPIGALHLRAGTDAILLDRHNNAAGAGTEAIYAHSLVVPAGAVLVTGGLKIYVESATINGTVSNPNDIVIVTGTPSCPADLSGDGVVNGQDLGVLLVMWGSCTAPCPADINVDGVVNGLDLGLMLTGWGSCAQ